MKAKISYSNLKPCPFCGEKVRTFMGPMGTQLFCCDNCGADVCFFGAEKEPKATQAWNRRPEDKEDLLN